MKLKMMKIFARIFATLLPALSVVIFIKSPLWGSVVMSLYHVIIIFFVSIIIWISSFKKDEYALPRALRIFGIFYIAIGFWGLSIMRGMHSVIVLYAIDMTKYEARFYVLVGILFIIFAGFKREHKYIYKKPEIIDI